MQVAVTDAVEILQRTPDVLDRWLRGLPDHWVRRNYGEGTFSPFDVVGHLISGELRDWIPRVQHLREHGENVPFVPFDRYDMYERDRDRSEDDLLDEFRTCRAGNLRVLRSMNLARADLARTGRHPELGIVTLGQLLATWAVHDLSHIAQIAKAMSFQYAGEIGPWIEYMGVLRDFRGGV